MTLELERKTKNQGNINLSWAAIPGMDRYEILNSH